MTHERDWLPWLTAAFTAVIGVMSITTATMPAISWRHGWRTHVLTQVVPISVVRFCYALSLPLGIALLLVSVYLLRRRWRARHVALALLSLSCAIDLLKGLEFEGAALSALTAGVLYWGAEEFPVVQAPITLRSAIWRVPLIGAIGVAVVAFVDWMTSGRPTPDVIFDQSSAAVRFRSTHAYFENHTLRAFGHVVSFQWIPLGIHLVEIGTLLGIVYVLFKPLAAPKLWPSAAVRRQAVQIVQTYGQDTLSFFKLRQDKFYFFNEARTAFVGYRVEAGMMLLSGDPVGPPGEFGDLLLAVRRFARARGLRLGALGASEALVPIYEGLGLRTLYLGDEAVVETERFTLQGRAVRKVRQSVHRLQRAGYSAELCRLDEIAPATMDQIEHVIKVGRIGPRERGFAMGMDDIHGLLEQDTLFVLSRDAQGTVRGVMHFVPTYGRAAMSLSLMRRDPGTPNGLMEFTVVAAIELLREQGIAEMSLNFAALTKYMRDPHGWYEHVVGRIASILDRFLQMESLYRFNVKFQPRWDLRYLIFEGRFGLARVALAGCWAEGQIPKPHLPHPEAHIGQRAIKIANR